jgi:L-lactate dehydrogenase complex protein LldE
MRVSLFITCYNDTLFPETGKAVVSVLERLGHSVEFRAAQTCCGQMHCNAGYRDDAIGLMRHFVDVYRDADTVCIPSASCAATVRDQYEKMAAETGDRQLHADVVALVSRVFEFSELLIDRLGVVDVGAAFPGTVTLHTSCHSLRSLRVGDRPERLLHAVRGLRLVHLSQADECCGFGGTFAIKNAEVSEAMLADKIKSIADTGAAVCTALDNSCLMHIGGSLRRIHPGVRCLHLAEILASTDSQGVAR